MKRRDYHNIDPILIMIRMKTVLFPSRMQCGDIIIIVSLKDAIHEIHDDQNYDNIDHDRSGENNILGEIKQVSKTNFQNIASLFCNLPFKPELFPRILYHDI